MATAQKPKVQIALVCVGELLLLGALWWTGVRQLEGINRAVNDISELRDPSPFRAALMGHLGKVHLGLRGYLRSADASLLEQVSLSRNDFASSLPEFEKQNPALFPRIATDEIKRTFTVFNDSINHALEANVKRLQDRSTLTQNFTRILTLLDRNVRPLIRNDQPDGEERKEAVLNVENQARAWQQNLTLAWAQPSHSAQELTLENDSRGGTYLARYGRMELLPRERKMQKEIQNLWQANSDLARDSFAREQVVVEAAGFMDTQRAQVVLALNKYLPAMPPSELQARKNGYVRSMRVHGVVACFLVLLGLVTLRFAGFGVYRLMRGEPLWIKKPTASAPATMAPTPIAKEPTIQMDLKGTITHWTSAAERLYGYTDTEITGKPISKLFESEEEVARFYKDLVSAPQTTFEATHKTKTGIFFRARIEFLTVPGTDGKPSAIGLICARR